MIQHALDGGYCQSQSIAGSVHIGDVTCLSAIDTEATRQANDERPLLAGIMAELLWPWHCVVVIRQKELVDGSYSLD